MILAVWPGSIPNTILSMHVNTHCRLHELDRLALLLRACVWSPRGRSALFQLGFTLIELLYVMAILGTLVAIATPKMQRYVDKARVARAMGDIETIQADLAGPEMLGEGLPPTLAEIGRVDVLDPWGRPYEYARYQFDPGTGEPKGNYRKDRFLKPINSTYDLYSMGEDGLTDEDLQADVSRDDVVRANDGGFIGLAFKF